MVKKRTLAIGIGGVLLIGGIVTVIVLAALGYFNKKGGPSPSPSPTPSPIPIIPRGSTCLAPEITSASYSSGKNGIDISFSPVSQECLIEFNNDFEFAIELYDSNGNPYGGETGLIKPVTPNMTSFFIPSIVLPPNNTFSASIKVSYGSWGSPRKMTSPLYNFNFST